LERADLIAELEALKGQGFDDLLLLTGERTGEADFDYLLGCVSTATGMFHNVTVESFAMTVDEYGKLGEAGCTGITLYQETYDESGYRDLHRWGPKRDYKFRIEAPGRALEAGLRTVGLGVLLGLGDPVRDAACLFQHVERLRKKYWRGGVSVSFPRTRDQLGGFRPSWPVNERLLARMIYAFRICLPDVPLVLSTRERAEFRDGMAGVGISRMSVASKTTVGGYHSPANSTEGQFSVADSRDVESFCEALMRKGQDPVFKNWDSVLR
jgi:2-iminoacetate synthase